MHFILNNVNGLLAREIHGRVQRARTNGDFSRVRVGVSRPHAIPVSALKRYIALSASERQW